MHALKIVVVRVMQDAPKIMQVYYANTLKIIQQHHKACVMYQKIENSLITCSRQAC